MIPIDMARPVVTCTRDEAVKLLKAGHIIRHKCFRKGASIYLDAKGKVMSPEWSRPSRMDAEELLAKFKDSETGWIDRGFRYGDARAALQWMEEGGVVQYDRAARHEGVYYFTRDAADSFIRVRNTDGHEHLRESKSTWLSLEGRRTFLLLPPTCTKLTYEELKRHLEKGGRWTIDSPDKQDWWFRRDGRDYYHGNSGVETNSMCGQYGCGISVEELDRVILLPPLEEMKPEPKLEPKDNANFEEAQRWMDMGGKVRRRHWRESYIFLVADIGMIGFHERDGIEARLWHPMQIDLLAADWEVYKE